MSTADVGHEGAAGEANEDPMAALGMFADPSFVENPYPFYDMLRENTPILSLPQFNATFLSRYDDIRRAFQDDRLQMQFERLQTVRMGPDVVNEPFFRFGRELLIFTDPPGHRPLKQIYGRAFRPARVKGLREYVTAMVHGLIDGFAGEGEVDIVAEYSKRVPLAVISYLLGVPEEDQSMVAQWAHEWRPVLDPTPVTREQLEALNNSVHAQEEYFSELIASRRAAPGDDFLSELIISNAEADSPVSDFQLLSNLMLLYFGGQDTQQRQFALALVALDQFPEQAQWLRDDPSRAPDAIPELLRYTPVGQVDGRIATEEITIGDVVVPEGHMVMLGLAAANRDPAEFERPNDLDLTRENAGRHLTFGLGTHHCLGSHLATQNIAIMLQALFERLSDVKPDLERAVPAHDVVLRGYEHLPVTWTTAN